MKKEKKTKQLNAWESDFGKNYTDRNIVDPKSRIEAFKKMIGDINIKTVLEAGCNCGHNLAALSLIKKYQLAGIEPSAYAIVKAKEEGIFPIIKGDCFGIPFVDSYFDLVFTCGVLIHIDVKDLPRAIDEIYRVSGKYILAIEYYSQKNAVISYRGHNDLLWKRDFKKHFLERKPDLKCVREGFLEKGSGFDNCSWWLFEKKKTLYEK